MHSYSSPFIKKIFECVCVYMGSVYVYVFDRNTFHIGMLLTCVPMACVYDLFISTFWCMCMCRHTHAKYMFMGLRPI